MIETILLPWEGDHGRSVAMKIASATAKSIVQGGYGPGDLLTEVTLADTHGASRTPAREAMLQLHTWGLVRLMPKKGALVTAVSAKERRDLLDVRAMCETRAVEVLADDDAGKLALLDRLYACIAAQQEALTEGDLLRFAQNDVAFHLRIIEAGDNLVIAEMLRGLGPRLARLIFQATIERPAAAAGFREEHVRLAAMIAAGDTVAFAAAVRAHINLGASAGGTA
ncbi:GntR family transcriptional regulator [Mycetocola saprophilus]|uniref:GntR family transcriptional regulator n=1 Tax=Mycetocola saprophilus TaxID=76636 RepID=UPI003BF1ABA5